MQWSFHDFNIFARYDCETLCSVSIAICIHHLKAGGLNPVRTATRGNLIANNLIFSNLADGSVVEEDCRFPELLQSPLGSQPRSRSSIAPKPQPLPLGVGRGQQYLPKHPLHRRVFSSPVAFSGLHKLPVQQTFIGPHGSQLFVSPFYDPSAKRESAPMQSARLTVSMNSMLEGMNGFQSGEFGSQSQERLKSTVLVQSCQSGVCAVRQELVTDGLDVDCVAECINTSQFSGNPSRDDELAGAEIQPATANLCAQENGNPRVNLMGAVGASNPLVNHVDFTFELPDICSSRPANVGSCLSRHKVSRTCIGPKLQQALVVPLAGTFSVTILPRPCRIEIWMRWIS